MTEAEWTTCGNPKAMLGFLGEEKKSSDRQFRLFSCACFRRVWKALTDERARLAVMVAERYADGLADDTERAEALGQVLDRNFGPHTTKWTVVALARTGALMAADAAGQTAACRPGGVYEPARWAAESEAQCELIRDIFGPLPFRSVTLASSWAKLEVRELASTMYETRDFRQMLRLGQLLREAGCDDRDVLHHCVWDSLHVRGCWLIDLLIGK